MMIKKKQKEHKDKVQKPFRKRDVGYAFYKAFRRMTQLVLVIIIFLLLGVSALWLRLQTGPIDLSFVQNKLVTLVNEQLGEYQVNLDKISLIWLNVQDPFVIETQNVEVLKNGYPFTTVEDVKIGLSPTAFIKAKIRPSFLKISNPEIALSHKDGELSLCCIVESEEISSTDSTAEVASDQSNQEDNINQLSKPVEVESLQVEIQEILHDIINDSFTGSYAFFQDVSAIELENVSLIMVDENNQSKPFSSFDLELRESGKSLVGSLKVEIFDEEKPGFIDTTLVYRDLQKDITFIGDVKNISSNSLDELFSNSQSFVDQDIVVNGKVTAAFNEEWKLSLAQLDVDIPVGEVRVGEQADKIFLIKDVALKSYYNRSEEKLNIDEFSGVVNDIDLSLKSEGFRKSGEVKLPILATISSISMEEISALIPPLENESSALSWPKHKLSKGALEDVSISLNLDIVKNKETRKREVKISDVKSDFVFKNMTVNYKDGLKPATEANGKGAYENDRLLIESDKANIQDVKASKVIVDLQELTVPNSGKGTVKIEAKGSLKTVLNYIADDPLNIKDLGFDAQNAAGDVDADIEINFPLVKGVKAEDFDVSVSATVVDALLPDVTVGLPVTGGPYSVTYKDSKLIVEGSGQLAKRPITFKWDQNTNTNKAILTADVTTDDGLRKAYGVNLEEYVKGKIPVQLTYNSQGDRKTFDIKGDITATDINLDAVDYIKTTGDKGAVSFKGLIEKDTLQEIDGLTVDAENLSIKNGRILFAKGEDLEISRGQFQEVTVNGNKLSAEFELTEDNLFKLIAKAVVFDATPFFAGEKTHKVDVGDAGSRPRQMSIEAEKLHLKNDITATNAKIYVATNSAGKLDALEMDAVIGKGDTVLRFKPDESTQSKRIFVESSDAGRFLKGAGLYKNVRGGFLSIKGQPVQDTSNILGQARIDNFRVKDAPIIAKLISTMSLTGIMKLLSDEGLTFTRLESDFEWRLRPQGDLIVIKNGRSSGSSLGLTFEGVVNRETKTIDLSGNVIPMSEVNKLIGDIPLIGDILTGGEALVAATYKIEGSIDDPKVTVNPLAALAPGFLRKILFEEDVEKKIKKAE